MPKTRNQRIDEYFNGDDWSMEDDLTLMDLLCYRSAHHPSLASIRIFDEIIKAVHLDLDRLLPNGKTLLDVKLRVRSLRSRFYDFKEFIGEPWVQFNPHTQTLTVDATHEVVEHVGQTRNTYKVILKFYIVYADKFNRI